VWMVAGIWIGMVLILVAMGMMATRHSVIMEHKLMDAAVDVVVANMDEAPNEWDVQPCRLTNAKRNMSMWIGNGRGQIGLRLDGLPANRSGNATILSMAHRRKLHDAAVRLQAHKMVRRFK
jgi:hypothetical protein